MFNLIFILILSVIFNFLSFVLFNNEKYRRLPEKRKDIFSVINLIILFLIGSLIEDYLLIGFILIIPGAILELLIFYKTVIK